MKLTIIHTTPATLKPLEELVRRLLPGTELTHMLDDSMLKDMIAGHDIDGVRRRWLAYAKIARDRQADVILSACSTVGEFAEEAGQLLDIPVLRIDSAMARMAVCAGGAIAVLATLSTTLEPTRRLLERTARALGKDCTITPTCIPGAYDALMAGNQKLHDSRIAAAIQAALAHSDTVVLAQASMARAAAGFPKEDLDRILTSPESGIAQLKELTFTHHETN